MGASTTEQLIRLLGRSGRAGGVVALLVGLGFGGAGWYLMEQRLDAGGTQYFFVSPLALVLGGAFAFTGLYLLVTGGGVFKGDDRFKPRTVEELLAQMATQPRPFFVCVDCRVVLPFEVAVGRCPRCSSASACLEVANDDDAKTVRAALGA